jgi:catechol 2,3-dioxygenase-like lactoylglutathione lyase family enzyme
MSGYSLVGTNDMKRAIGFYDVVLRAMDIERSFEAPNGVFYGAGGGRPSFGVVRPFDGQAATTGNGCMIAFHVADRQTVRAAHAKALELGAKDEGAPGVRGGEQSDFYGAYFRDLEGNKLCVYHWPES